MLQPSAPGFVRKMIGLLHPVPHVLDGLLLVAGSIIYGRRCRRATGIDWRDMTDSEQVERLLCWYDGNARTLPWRVSPQERAAGKVPDPYLVWLSEVMLQQTTVPVAARYFEEFRCRWPSLVSLAQAAEEDVMAAWAGLGYYARARNLVRCARTVLKDHDGAFPCEIAALQRLPGIGPYTASAIAAMAFDVQTLAVDGNVERVMARVHAVRTPLPDAKPKLRKLAGRLPPADRPGDFAQAVIELGALVCRPRNPRCSECPWRCGCRARALGIESSLPARKPRNAKPLHRGEAYVGRRTDGAWLVERRPSSGLLGGTLGWPGSGWGGAAGSSPPWRGRWQRTDGVVRHEFTHFKLELSVFTASIPLSAEVERGEFVPADSFSPGSMPSLMQKVYKLAADSFTTS